MVEIPEYRFFAAARVASQLAMELPLPLYQELCKRTEIPQFIKANWGDYKSVPCVFLLTDEMAHRVDMMLGPHAQTVFRVWVIQVLSQEVS